MGIARATRRCPAMLLRRAAARRPSHREPPGATLRQRLGRSPPPSLRPRMLAGVAEEVSSRRRSRVGLCGGDAVLAVLPAGGGARCCWGPLRRSPAARARGAARRDTSSAHGVTCGQTRAAAAPAGTASPAAVGEPPQASRLRCRTSSPRLRAARLPRVKKSSGRNAAATARPGGAGRIAISSELEDTCDPLQLDDHGTGRGRTLQTWLAEACSRRGSTERASRRGNRWLRRVLGARGADGALLRQYDVSGRPGRGVPIPLRADARGRQLVARRRHRRQGSRTATSRPSRRSWRRAARCR